MKKTKTQAQKTQLKNFSPKTQNYGKSFEKLRRFLTKYNKFCLQSGKIVQKLKNLPKTQSKISKNLKFTANPLPYIFRKIVQKKPALDSFWYVLRILHMYLIAAPLGTLSGSTTLRNQTAPPTPPSPRESTSLYNPAIRGYSLKDKNAKYASVPK